METPFTLTLDDRARLTALIRALQERAEPLQQENRFHCAGRMPEVLEAILDPKSPSESGVFVLPWQIAELQILGVLPCNTATEIAAPAEDLKANWRRADTATMNRFWRKFKNPNTAKPRRFGSKLKKRSKPSNAH